MPLRVVLIAGTALWLAGCADDSGVPLATQAPPVSAQPPAPVLADYRLGPLDTVSVNVFAEPELSVASAPVGLNGDIALPLLGPVPAAGRTTEDLATEITTRLNARYLKRASVAVALVRSVNRTVTVEGQVNRSGIFEITGPRLTLLQAVALGEGTSEYAKLDEVVVIRTVDGQRYAARFDLREIQAGRFVDPEIQPSDIVVVGFSRATRILRDAIALLPGAAGLFIAINQ